MNILLTMLMHIKQNVMSNKELIRELQAYPDDAIVQINSPKHDKGSEDISHLIIEDEYNNSDLATCVGKIYIDLIGE